MASTVYTLYSTVCIETVYIPSPRVRNLLLQDRFAEGRFLPPVDTQQDWTMVSGREENGWTIMAFSRALQTGDDRDRDIVQVCMPTAVLCSYTATQWILDAICHWCMVSLVCMGTLHTLPKVYMNH